MHLFHHPFIHFLIHFLIHPFFSDPVIYSFVQVISCSCVFYWNHSLFCSSHFRFMCILLKPFIILFKSFPIHVYFTETFHYFVQVISRLCVFYWNRSFAHVFLYLSICSLFRSALYSCLHSIASSTSHTVTQSIHLFIHSIIYSSKFILSI